jgi:hypothetical protein
LRKKKKDYQISQDGAVTTIHYDAPGGWEQWFLLMSDNHFDSIYCARDLMTEHLELAKKRRARIMVFGDFFDAMQGRFDPRRSMDELREEYRREDYYDYVVKDARDYLLPYAHLIDILADGNHELSVLKNANTNLPDRLVYALNDKAGSKIVHGGYGGWVRYMFNLSDGGFGKRTSIKLKYFHGSGGDAPVTKGVMHTNRQAVFLPDANIVVNGHNHNQYHLVLNRERISNKGELYFDLQHHIRVPGYKQSYGDGTGGWDVTRGAPPKPVGGVWLRFYTLNSQIKIQVTPDITGGEPLSVNSDTVYAGRVYDDDGEEE